MKQVYLIIYYKVVIDGERAVRTHHKEEYKFNDIDEIVNVNQVNAIEQHLKDKHSANIIEITGIVPLRKE